MTPAARVLLIEDEPALARGLSDTLRANGFDVIVATDGDRGLDAATRGDVDLILLDVMLPKKDGLSVCRELRRSGISTPIIVLTAKAEEASKVLGLELGADDYVTKPFSSLELRARIKAVLRRRTNDAPEQYRFGDVEVDFPRGEVEVDGRNLYFDEFDYSVSFTSTPAVK